MNEKEVHERLTSTFSRQLNELTEALYAKSEGVSEDVGFNGAIYNRCVDEAVFLIIADMLEQALDLGLQPRLEALIEEQEGLRL